MIDLFRGEGSLRTGSNSIDNDLLPFYTIIHKQLNRVNSF